MQAKASLTYLCAQVPTQSTGTSLLSISPSFRQGSFGILFFSFLFLFFPFFKENKTPYSKSVLYVVRTSESLIPYYFGVK